MRRFGPFELEARLGRGGSAEVWRATRRGPHGFARTVALKRLLPERRDPRLERALLDEARLAARLAHHNIAQVLEVVEVAGEPAIVMELVDGCELRALLEAMAPLGPPPPGLGAHVAHEVCRALAAAHAERPPILHRDVGPTNVLVSRGGSVKLADFGIGKALHDGGDDKTGSFKGNLGYMAPEQLARAPLGPTADVYAAGVLLWELLTGRRLFVALDLATTSDARLRPIAPPSSLSPTVPEALDAIVARALSASPERRFADGAAMAEALAPIAHQLGFGTTQLAALMRDHAPPPVAPEPGRHTETNAPAPPANGARATPTGRPMPRRRAWLAAPALLLIVAVVVAAAAWLALPPPIAAVNPPPLVAPPRASPATTAPLPLPSPSPSPSPSPPPPPGSVLPAKPTPPSRRAPPATVKRHPAARPDLVEGRLVDPFHR